MADKMQMMSPLLTLSNKMRTMLMALLLPPPLMPKVCHWALSTGFNLACSAALNMRPMLERRRRLLTPSQAAVARVLPTAMLWCGVAGMAAAALALLLAASGGRRRARLALAYAALAAAAANHCLCAWLFALLLVPDAGWSWAYLLLAIFATAGIVFFATRDLAGFRSLRKAAAAADQEAAGKNAQ